MRHDRSQVLHPIVDALPVPPVAPGRALRILRSPVRPPERRTVTTGPRALERPPRSPSPTGDPDVVRHVEARRPEAPPRVTEAGVDTNRERLIEIRTKIRSLLVEDDASDASLTRECLAVCLGATIEVTHETRLASALARLAIDPFDLVILDLDLPDSRGLATCERLIEAHPGIPVVVLTGADDDSTGVRAIQRGAQDFLSKNGLDAEGLSRAIRHSLERHGMVARLETAASDARRSASRLRNLIARSAEGFVVLDARGVVLLANPAAESLLGFTPDEAIGHAIAFPPVTGATSEVMVPRTDGTAFPAELRFAALEWEGHETTLVSIHDLSDRKRVERMVVAQTVQRAFLPDRTDKAAGSLRLSATHELCEDASGDYYDFIDLDADRVVVAIGDVAGHGLGPALLMAQARACLRAFLRAFGRSSADLSSILGHVNDALAADMVDGRFMSLFVGIIDARQGHLLWCNAGHISPFLRRADTRVIERLEPTGPVLGVRAGFEFPTRTTTIRKGDLFLACSDGATEAVSTSEERFGEDRIRSCLQRDPSLGAARSIDALRDDIRAWTGSAPIHDDLTLLAIDRTAVTAQDERSGPADVRGA